MKKFCLPLIISAALITLIISGTTSTQAATVGCTATYSVTWGDTLSGIAFHHNTTWQILQNINALRNPNVLYPGQSLCLARINTMTISQPVKGSGNYFSFPQCTWGANQKYHDLHGIWVPWTTQANANQWPDRAREFHWQVDTKPKPGDIFVLAPWHQGAWGLGHVGVVLSVTNATFVGTSTNWAPRFTSFTNVTYSSANGVQFLRY